MGRQRKARRREAVDGTKSDRGQACKRRGQFPGYLHGRGGSWMLGTLVVERVREVRELFVSYIMKDLIIRRLLPGAFVFCGCNP